jgi:hypothetical protein
MNPYILHALSDYSKDEERLKILNHTPYLFKSFYSLLSPIESPKDGGFIFIKNQSIFFIDVGLYQACLGGHMAIVVLMIEKRKRSSFRIFDWGLVGSCEGGNEDLVKMMISKGANDFNWGLEGACRGGHQNLMNLMIEKGATKCQRCHKSLEEHLQKPLQSPQNNRL